MNTAKKILYSGTDEANQLRNGFVDAKTNKDAVEQLKAAGLTNIKLHYDSTIAGRRDDLVGLDEKQLQRVAALEIKVHEGDARLAMVSALILNNIGLVLFGVFFLCLGAISKDEISFFVGVLILAYIPAHALWNGRYLRNYRKLLTCFAHGDWQQSKRLIAKLKKASPDPELELDVDYRRAQIHAIEGNISKGIEILSRWEHRINSDKPGLFYSKLAAVHHANKDYEQCLHYMRLAHEKYPDSPIYKIDLALAEAMFGQVETAEALLNSINIEEIPVFALPHLDYTKGVIALRSNKPGATSLLTNAQLDMANRVNNPAVLPSLAICSGFLSLSLHNDGQIDEAKSLLDRFWPVIKPHADDLLINELKEKFNVN